MSNAFVEFPTFDNDFVDFDRPKYLRFREGFPTTVRILDKNAFSVRKHWINKARTSLLCLGETCPVCASNDKIRGENPKNFRNIKGYIPVQFRYMVNVLDRTMVVIDPETEEEHYAQKGTFPLISSDNERSLAGIDPQPSNTIKILERGKTLFENFLAIHNETAEFNDEQELISGGLTAFDLKLLTLGAGVEMTISVMPILQSNDDISAILEENEIVLHDLSTVGITLTPDEMEQVAYAGVTLSDVFAARKADEDAETTEEMATTLADVSDSVKELFDDESVGVEA